MGICVWCPGFKCCRSKRKQTGNKLKYKYTTFI